MRKALYLFISLLLAVTSCIERPEVTMNHLLRQADGMIRTAPDTAFYFLQSLKEFPVTTEDDSIFLELLLCEARIKNDIKLEDTLAINSLTSYYSAKADTLMMARTYRLSALAYRDLGYYEETVSRFNTAIALAMKMDYKRLLADEYNELAHVHYSQRLFADPDYIRTLSDSIFHLAELSAIELKDTTLWINSLISRSLIPRYYRRYTEERDLLLQALALAVNSNEQGYETTISMFLSLVYAELGEKEESFAFAKRNLALRKGKIPKYVYCLTLGNAYQRIGIKDSADYYLAKGKELRIKAETEYPNSSNLFTQRVESKYTLEQRIQQMRIDDSYRQQRIEERNNYMASICILVLVLVFVVCLIRKKHLRRETLYREETEVEKQQLTHAHNQTRKQLQQEQEELKRKNQELALMQQKVALLSADAGSVFDKINQIAGESQYKEDSGLLLEESDWRLLQFEMDKRWNNSISNLQQEYHLTSNEVRLLCLNLLDVPTARIPYFFERTVGTIYNWNRQLCSKLGIVRNDQLTFKEDFKRFISNRN